MNKGDKINHQGKQLKPHTSWGKETMKFKVDKKNRLHNTERVRCTGVLCKKKARTDRTYVFKGRECQSCYSAFFDDLRYSPRAETPHFDAQFLTRLDLV